MTPDVTRLREIRHNLNPHNRIALEAWEHAVIGVIDALLAPPADPAMTGEGCPQCGTTFGEAHQPTCRWRTPDGAAGEPTAQIGVSGPIDGMGTPDRSGPYITVVVMDDRGGGRLTRRISLGAAEVLAAELAGILGTPAPGEAPGAKKSPVDIWADPVFLAAIRAWSDKVRPDPVDDADFAAGWNAALSAARPAAPVTEITENDLQATKKLLDDFLAPWGSWKTEWWEGIAGNLEFSDHNMLRIIHGRLVRLAARGSA
jgi:hypothetical protein